MVIAYLFWGFILALIVACIGMAHKRGLDWFSHVGAVTLNYIIPATGAVAPTAAQVATMMIVDVKATADGDTTATIPHLMGTAPLLVTSQQLISQALTALSAWAATTIDATNVVMTKLTSTGSGNASAQLRVIIMKPHTLIQ